MSYINIMQEMFEDIKAVNRGTDNAMAIGNRKKIKTMIQKTDVLSSSCSTRGTRRGTVIRHDHHMCGNMFWAPIYVNQMQITLKVGYNLYSNNQISCMNLSLTKSCPLTHHSRGTLHQQICFLFQFILSPFLYWSLLVYNLHLYLRYFYFIIIIGMLKPRFRNLFLSTLQVINTLKHRAVKLTRDSGNTRRNLTEFPFDVINTASFGIIFYLQSEQDRTLNSSGN